MMNRYALRTKETLLYLPLLVPSRSPSGTATASLQKTGLPGRAAKEETERMA